MQAAKENNKNTRQGYVESAVWFQLSLDAWQILN